MYLCPSLQFAKLLFSKSSLLDNFSKSPGRERAGMHRNVGLSAIRVTKDFMAASLPNFDKSNPKKLG